MADELTALRNVHVGANEENGELIFSHKVLPGPADQSYGINVAKLAGLPESLIDRAAKILANLEAQDVSLKTAPMQATQLTDTVTTMATTDTSVTDTPIEQAQVTETQADAQLSLFDLPDPDRKSVV